MPFGAKTAEADPAKALAVRQAVADLVDRQAIADQVYKGTYLPLYSFVPDGFAGATELLKDLYGDGNGGPSRQGQGDPRGRRRRDPRHAEPAVQPGPLRPVLGRRVRMSRTSSRRPACSRSTCSPPSGSLLEGPHGRCVPGLPARLVPGLLDADNYLTPFFLTENFLKNHYNDPQVEELIIKQADHR